MINDIKSAKEMFGDDFDELLEGFIDEVKSNIEGASAKLENTNEWDSELLDETLAKLHGLKGITGQLGFSFLSKSIHSVEDKFAEAKKNGHMPETGYLTGLEHFLSQVLSYIEELEENGVDCDEATITSICEKVEDAIDLESEKASSSRPRPQEKADSPSRDKINTASDLKNYQLTQESYQNIFSRMLETLRLFKEESFDLPSAVLHAEKSLFSLSQARLIKIKPLFRKVQKLVDELQSRLEKKVDVEFIGADEMIDRLIYSSLGEVLVHLVKNALDHGIEMPGERVEFNKEESGKLSLIFERSEEGFKLIIKDDGRGLDPDKIAKIAVEKGVITEDDLSLMTDYEKQFLVFASGFSTRDEATDVSGRGVGMDAVYKEVKRNGGKLTLDSTLGEGTSFILEWPSAFKMVESLVFKLEDRLYSFPAKSIVAAYVEESHYTLTDGGVEILNKGELMPLVELGFSRATSGSLVVIDAGGFNVALLVDELIGCWNMFFQAVAPSVEFSPLIIGLSKFDTDTYVHGLNMNELCMNLNDYMSADDVEEDTEKNTEEDLIEKIGTKNNMKKEGSPMDTLEFEKLGGDMTREDVYNFLDDEKFINEVQSTLEPLKSNEKAYNNVLEYVANHFDSFKKVIENVDVSDEIEYMVAIKYAYLKCDWIMFNVEVQYVSMSGKDVDEEIMYRAAICASMIERFESIVNPKAISQITGVLAEPADDIAA